MTFAPEARPPPGGDAERHRRRSWYPQYPRRSNPGRVDRAAPGVTPKELRFDLKKFRYMLEKGRIALLFDGFDELAQRVSYDSTTEHFDTLLEAAGGQAKVVVTSRTHHFVSDKQVRSALMHRAEALVRAPGFAT